MNKASDGILAATVLALTLFPCAGCRRVAQGELYGSYVAEYDTGTSTLRLEDDGTFSQTTEVERGRKVTSRGRWDFRPSKGVFGEVVLHDCLVSHDGFGRLKEDPQRGVCVEPVEREYLVAGTIRIGVSDMHPYVKLDAPTKP